MLFIAERVDNDYNILSAKLLSSLPHLYWIYCATCSGMKKRKKKLHGKRADLDDVLGEMCAGVREKGK